MSALRIASWAKRAVGTSSQALQGSMALLQRAASSGAGASERPYDPEFPDGSEFDEDASGDIERLRLDVLRRALKKVPTSGWSRAALNEAAHEAGMSAASAGLLGARPEGQLVEFFIERCNERLVEYIDSNAFREAPDDSKLFSCIKTRLKMNAPHVASGTWAQAMAIMARPENVSTLLRQQHGMVSEIARATRTEPASNASDLAYKAMIAAAYGVAEVSMLSDKSDGFHDTWRTLERELALWERRGSRR